MKLRAAGAGRRGRQNTGRRRSVNHPRSAGYHRTLSDSQARKCRPDLLRDMPRTPSAESVLHFDSLEDRRQRENLAAPAPCRFPSIIFFNSRARFSPPSTSVLKTQKQTRASCLIGSGTPTAAASVTATCATRIDSTSAGPRRLPATSSPFNANILAVLQFRGRALATADRTASPRGSLRAGAPRERARERQRTCSP